MPRHADPYLEQRILDAAQKLWKKGGEKALTMRAVAQAAGTTTPTVYERFASREQLVLALLRRIQREFARIVESGRSAEELCQRYLEFALDRPLEYQLFFAHQEALNREARRRRVPLQSSEVRPGFEAATRKLAEWMGGSPKDYMQLALALLALAHGTAMLLISQAAPDGLTVELRKSFARAVSAILRDLAPHANRA